ncbi:hypothetical protein Tco_1436232 [Tanacetum coccineum]
MKHSTRAAAEFLQVHEQDQEFILKTLTTCRCNAIRWCMPWGCLSRWQVKWVISVLFSGVSFLFRLQMLECLDHCSKEWKLLVRAQLGVWASRNEAIFD